MALRKRVSLALMVAAVVGFAMPMLAEEPSLPAALHSAEKHASLAADAQRLSDVRMHLQHALDCLEGAKGVITTRRRAIRMVAKGRWNHFQPARQTGCELKRPSSSPRWESPSRISIRRTTPRKRSRPCSERRRLRNERAGG